MKRGGSDWRASWTEMAAVNSKGETLLHYGAREVREIAHAQSCALRQPPKSTCCLSLSSRTSWSLMAQ